eukprot:CAMPEP_0117525168 /NCGR_PEP_ID=MMETSP0784-20121206/35627_1 /TAXON_ID=39447 /ORGANISM="" /LENGTH=461 /DNA_ID=CAMNT_0005321349 /DNA_START=183 /DNA_END=1565 /DNA_ORIENTATION=-
MTTLRETCAVGFVDELEFGLLKKCAKSLHWKTAERAALLDMRIDTMMFESGVKRIEVCVRSLCHSRAVTVDHLLFKERFNGKPCLLVLGSVSKVPKPWAQLIQPAMFLFSSGFNVLWVEVPTFATDGIRWLQYGPDIIKTVVKFFYVTSVSVLTCGIGGSVFLMSLARFPECFSNKHFLFNLDLPTMKNMVYDLPEIEEVLRTRTMQLWLAYNDEEDIYNHMHDTMPAKAYDAMSKVQTRLEGERRRTGSTRKFDEILFTESLNLPRLSVKPKVERVKRIKLGLNTVFAFSDALLVAVSSYMQIPPSLTQQEIGVGLAGESVSPEVLAIRQDVMPELPAHRKQQTMSVDTRRAKASANRVRQKRFTSLMDAYVTDLPQLMPPPFPGGSGSLRLQLGSSASAPALALERANGEANFARDLQVALGAKEEEAEEESLLALFFPQAAKKAALEDVKGGEPQESN